MRCVRGVSMGWLGLAAALVAVIWPCESQAFRNIDPLNPEEVAALPFEARALYSEAIEAVDYIRYDEGLNKLAKAAELAKDSIALQFLCARGHQLRAEVKSREASVALYDLSLKCLERILSNRKALPAHRERAELIKKMILKAKDRIPQRDERRVQMGLSIQRQLAQELAVPLAIKGAEKKKAGRRVVLAGRDGGGGGRGGRGGGDEGYRVDRPDQ